MCIEKMAFLFNQSGKALLEKKEERAQNFRY